MDEKYPLSHELDKIARDQAMQVADEQEEYLLQFFGSYEIAKEVAHLFVFEEYPMEFEDLSNDFDNTITYRLTTQYRIRPKTLEELQAEGIIR